MSKAEELILIIDFGSQVTQLIARRIREIGVYCEIYPYNSATIDRIKAAQPKGIILSGGPSSVNDTQDAPTISKKIFDLGVPILGICYGQQLLCSMLGGEVESGNSREFGPSYITISKVSKLFGATWRVGDGQHKVWMSHGDHITSLPEGFEKVAESDGAPFAVIANEEKRFYGVQFHPEVTHTEKGTELLSNFALDVCGCKGNWNMSSFLERSVAEIKEIVGDHKVICAVSGGVDSSVVATLIHKAIGDQLTCIFVDTGVLRKNEADIVNKRFKDQYHIPIHHVDASSIFLSELENIKDPEQKRKIIGKTFIDIFENEAKELGGAHFLAQGTLYPDVIESVSVHGDAAVTIKSHHNVGGLPDRMDMKLLEPVRELFKDEVRALGREMGMSDELIQRHPFPGPGLAIRLPGAITKERIRILQEADAIYLDEIRSAGLYDEIWQAFAVLLPVRTVGVMGDSRTYEYVCALRAVTSTDGMTADFYDFSHEFLRSVSSRIINNVKGINRVVYDISTKPPGTIEWE